MLDASHCQHHHVVVDHILTDGADWTVTLKGCSGLCQPGRCSHFFFLSIISVGPDVLLTCVVET